MAEDKPEPVKLVLKKLKARNSSQQTLNRYELYVKKFIDYLQNKKQKFWKQATCDDLTDFLSELDICGNTKFTMFYAYRTIFQIWGIKWTLDKADVPKKSNPSRPWYTDEEVNKIVQTADKLSAKASALTRIARDCGCRRAAIHKMNKEDFLDLKPPILKVPDIKHGRPSDMVICDDTAEYIRKMISKRIDKDNALFINEKGERMSLVDLSNLFHDIAVYSGCYKPRAGIHAMRRSKVTRLRKAGLDEFDIVETMGWRPGSPMVHTYCQLDRGDIQKKAAQADPLMKKEGEKTNNEPR